MAVGSPVCSLNVALQILIAKKPQVRRQPVAAVGAEQAGRGNADRFGVADAPTVLFEQLVDFVQQTRGKAIEVVLVLVALKEPVVDLVVRIGEQPDLDAQPGADVDGNAKTFHVYRPSARELADACSFSL